MRYQKPALTFEAQLGLLVNRGLQVTDHERALRWLNRVSYYRLSAYFVPFKVGATDTFRPGARFEAIVDLYKFDTRLRLLVIQAIERVEISVRTAITYNIATQYGAWGHTDARNFDPSFDHQKFLSELEDEEQRCGETFVAHYRTKYRSEQHLPIWMATELMSFGTLSLVYKHLGPKIQRSIAEEYGVPGDVFRTWLHMLSYVRNICAHHKRLWNRILAIRPRIPWKWQYAVGSSDRLYCVLVIIQHLVTTACTPQCQWRARLITLLDSHPDVNRQAMGFPNDWKALAPWA